MRGGKVNSILLKYKVIPLLHLKGFILILNMQSISLFFFWRQKK
jgi:hypothetical protein